MHPVRAIFKDICDREKRCRWALYRPVTIGPTRLFALIDAMNGETSELWELRPEARRAIASQCSLPATAIESVLEVTSHDPDAPWYDECERLPDDARILTPADDEYPTALFELEQPAPFLYVRGSLRLGELVSPVAVVGSRKIDFEGTRLAKRISTQIAQTGTTVVSGGALGVDSLAHRAALSAGVPTIAVLPGGLNRLTPRRHRKLFDDIRSCGALVTEYPLDISARKYHFHRRNDVIAALSCAVLVVRARSRSGTMITARAAKRLQRPLYVVPGSPEDPFSEGCLDLLVEGAVPVRHGREVTGGRETDSGDRDDTPNTLTRRRLEGLSENARILLELLPHGGFKSPDELSRESEFTSSQIATALLELELRGLVKRKSGANSYRRAA